MLTQRTSYTGLAQMPAPRLGLGDRSGVAAGLVIRDDDNRVVKLETPERHAIS